MIDVDQTARARDAAFHQVEQIGAAGEIGRAGSEAAATASAIVAGRT